MIEKFVIVRELNSNPVNGNMVSERYKTEEIESALGGAKISSEEIQFRDNKIYLILKCEQELKKEKKSILDAIQPKQ